MTRTDYDGKITVLTIPGQVNGPKLANNAITTDTAVSQDIGLIGRDNQNRIHWGNLLTLPVAQGGLLYVEPVYASPGATDAASSYPRLIRVAMMYEDRVGYGPTVRDALTELFGPGADATATGPATDGRVLAPSTNSGYIYALSPDSGRVAYIHLGAQNNLFSVPIAGGTPVRLNGTENLRAFLRINATSTRAVYEATTGTGPALFSAPLDGNGTRYNLTESLTGAWAVTGHALTPGSGTVVYTIQRGALDAPLEAFSSRLTPAILPPIP